MQHGKLGMSMMHLAGVTEQLTAQAGRPGRSVLDGAMLEEALEVQLILWHTPSMIHCWHCLITHSNAAVLLTCLPALHSSTLPVSLLVTSLTCEARMLHALASCQMMQPVEHLGKLCQNNTRMMICAGCAGCDSFG